MDHRAAIVVYPQVEELDMIGPYETLSHSDSIEIDLLSKSLEPVRAYNGLRFLPDKTLSDTDDYDIVIVPGGEGRKKAMRDKEILNFLEEQVESVSYLCSVCTGVFLLAETGMLEGLKATTHHSALDELRSSYPEIDVLEERVVKNDTEPKIWCAAGISSGIDISLEPLKELFGEEMAKKAADRMEYEYYRIS